MATTAFTNAYREGLIRATMGDGDVFKMALYNGSGHNSNSALYSASNESSGSGYVAKGFTMVGIARTIDTTNNVGYLDWTTNPNWPASTITATDSLLFDETATVPQTDASVGVFDFNGSRSTSNGTFTLTLPSPAFNSALVRLA